VPPTFPSPFIRAPRDTAIGDPATADLCSAVGVATFAQLRSGTVTQDPVQYPPGCSFTLSTAGAPVLTVSVFAARHDPAPAEGRTERTSSGLDVYSYPFDSTSGACERDIVTQHLRFVADAIPRGSAKPDEHLSCAATDAMARRVAEVVAHGSVPRLSLAQPTLTQLNACKVAQAAGMTELSDFAAAELAVRGFGINCELQTRDVYLFINAALAAETPPSPGVPVTVGGHELYRITARAGFCSYASVQGRTDAGQHEEVTAQATVPAGGNAPQQLCDQTAEALARYLTTAGLR
jgi:hypothetical protein